jgi:hypothetical protein
MVFTSLFTLGILLAPVSSNVLYGRDIDGSLKRLSWEKRANAGDVLRLPLTNNADQSYSVPVLMGTPYQQVPMAISLSQNYIIVASPESSGNTSGFYNPSQSSTYAQTNATTAVQGLNGQSFPATFAAETCSVANFSYDASVAITPAAAGSIYPLGCHGVLGYGIDGQTNPANNSLLGVYIPSGANMAVCGIELNWPGDANQGIFTMGGVDTSAYTGNFTTMTVPSATSVQRPSWSIPVDSIIVGVGQGVQPISGSVASIDPYYPDIELPSDVVANLYSKIPNAAASSSNPSRYTVPCSTQIQLTMIFGGKNFTMDPRDAITNENGTCYGVVQAAPASSSGNVIYKIGSPFMRNVYTAFEANGLQSTPMLTVSFAQKVLRSGARSNSANSGTANKPSLSLLLAVLTCIYVIVS